MTTKQNKLGKEILDEIERLEAQPIVDYDTSLNVDKIAEYLAKIKNPMVIPLVSRILEQTQIISTSEVISNITKSLNLFLAKNLDFYVYLNLDSSMIYFVAKIYHLIKDLPNFHGFITEDNNTEITEKKFNLVIIDDASYSGCTILDAIDGITYKKKSTRFVNCHIIVSHIANPQNLQQELNGNHSIELYPFKKIEHIDFNKEEQSILGMETESASPFIFQHKVGNAFGSFPQIYKYGYLYPPHKNVFKYRGFDEKDGFKASGEEFVGSLFNITPSRKFIGLN